ncbi:acylphosphatase [Thermanaeromonas toyohensis ToBE]|uniref:acylphosphatase n=1 Tax=Thermanaeromonas toyohensis ToBE TaxID=698762 RepID=A0A1W1W239_9FIRM|nr:acylphosphatase [Thermanaeromonas toyohensis]SMB99540.1 acylphosphatase [Thermanaeromonas toyohensis ToBE]
MAMVRAYFNIRGRVQGVGFRYFAREHAVALGINGWIRNCYDGTVEGVAEGPREKVEKFLSLCRQGPRWAQVEGMEVRYEEPQGEKGFTIRETI